MRVLSNCIGYVTVLRLSFYSYSLVVAVDVVVLSFTHLVIYQSSSAIEFALNEKQLQLNARWSLKEVNF